MLSKGNFKFLLNRNIVLPQMRYICNDRKDNSVKNKSTKLKILSVKELKKHSLRTSDAKNYSAPSKAAIPETYKEFMSYLPNVIGKLKEKVEAYDHLGFGKHIERLLEYTLPGGKKFRGIFVLETFKRMAPKYSENDLKLVIYLGWCAELLHASFLMMDDIMDGSLMRRKRKCWHTFEDIGLTAVNDALIIESCAYQLLRDQLSNLSCYVGIMELFHESTFIGAVGQQMDVSSTNQDVLSFTMEQYRAISSNKASDSIYRCFSLGTYFAGYTQGCEQPQKVSKETKNLLKEIGIYALVQNDYLDCYGKIEDSGAIGTDIQTGKCTWLVVTFLERATEAQKALLKECYGKNDEASVKRVKQLYNEVKLEEVYFEYEKNTFNSLKKEIEESHDKSLIICLEILNQMVLRPQYN